MHTQRLRTYLVVAVILLLGSGGGWTENLADAADPDFSKNTDLLKGRRLLLPADDLVATIFGPGNPAEVRNWVNFTTAGDTDIGTYPILSNANAFATGAGRMFNRPHDIVITMTGPPGGINVLDPQPDNPLNTRGFPFPRTPRGLAMADFNGDGFADVAVLAADDPTSTSGLVQILTANDVNDLSAGLFASDGVRPEFINFSTPIAITTGDFNGDGRPEVAIAQAFPLGGTKILVYIFEVLTNENGTIANQALQQVASVTLDSPFGLAVSEVALVAGNYRGQDNTNSGTGLPMADLVLVVNHGINDVIAQSLKVSVASTNPLSFAIVPANTFWILVQNEDFGLALRGVKSGRFDLLGTTDQVVVAVHGVSIPSNLVPAIPGSMVQILTLDSALEFAAAGTQTYWILPERGSIRRGEVLDIAIGYFEPPSSDGTPNFNLELAVLVDGPSVDPAALGSEIFRVDPNNNFSLTFAYATSLKVVVGPCTDCRFALTPGDLQGKSLLLGAPEVVRISGDIRPDIVLAIPPMHIDWINPGIELDSAEYPGCNKPPTPCQLNLTVLPKVSAPGVAFTTQYAFSSSDSTTANRKSTTSWSLSTKVTDEQKLTYGNIALEGVSVTLKESAGFTHDSLVSKEYNTYSGISDNLTATTAFADHVFYTEHTLNLYYYPVIGHTICPADQPNCPDSAKYPLYVVYSGPDQVSHIAVDATNLEWYQQPHEPGNALSYPSSLTQLQATFPTGVQPLTDDPPQWFLTDTSQATLSTTWSESKGTSQTTGSTNTETASLSISVAATVSEGLATVHTEGTFELNQSASVNTLNVTKQDLSASTGITISKPSFGSVVADNYSYNFAGYVFGLTAPAGTLQNIDLTDQDGNPIDIQTTGPMFVGFVADPLRQGTQTWWTDAYNLPDVGVHHPARWDWSVTKYTASFNTPQRKISPVDQDFYRMKGLFITPCVPNTPADGFCDANVQGPNRSTATDGDPLLLQARVYNYSLVGTTAPVHVRFYRQQIEGDTLQGDSVLIGEDVLTSIPPFTSSNTPPAVQQPNWVMASTPFDTTGLGGTVGQYFVFWVVVWMQDADGNLMPEIPDHGLTTVFQDDIKAGTPFAQATDVPIEPHSNNVGLYGHGTAFFIFPPASGPAASASTPATSAAILGDLAIDRLSVPASPLLLDHKVKIVAHLRTDDTRSGPMSVTFYDGDPQAGGRLFDVHHISYVRANDTYVSKGFFRPQTCGDHTIVVVAAPASAAPARAEATVPVSIIPAGLGRGADHLHEAPGPAHRSQSKATRQIETGQTRV